MYKNILVLLDSSEIAEHSVSTAIRLARVFDGKITLLQIIEILPILQSDRKLEERALDNQAKSYLASIKERIEKEGISAKIVIKQGKPDKVICEYTKSQDIDLVIMTSHGLGGITRWALGSVSDKVLRHSAKPVLLLRQPS